MAELKADLAAGSSHSVQNDSGTRGSMAERSSVGWASDKEDDIAGSGYVLLPAERGAPSGRHTRQTVSLVRLPAVFQVTQSTKIPQTRLLLFRALAFGWCFSCGFVYGWFWQSDWHKGKDHNPPPVFLTEWGFVATLVFQFSALTATLVEWLTHDNEMLVVVGGQRSCCRKMDALFAWWLQVAILAFHLAVTIEPLIVVGFWTLVYPTTGGCEFPSCVTVHGIGCVLLLVDGVLNEIRILPRLCPAAVGYILLWELSQLWWVRTGHEQDYDVLSMDGWVSVLLCAGGLGTACLNFFLLKRTLLRREGDEDY